MATPGSLSWEGEYNNEESMMNGDAKNMVEIETSKQIEPSLEDQENVVTTNEADEKGMAAVRVSTSKRTSNTDQDDEELRYSHHAFPHKEHGGDNDDATYKKSFFVRRAEAMAHRPWTHLLIALSISVLLSVIGMIVGNFEVAVDNAGWESRGTKIADRHTQMLMVLTYRDDLFYDTDGSVWEDLQTNVQPGWEDSEDDAADEEEYRRRTASYSSSSFLSSPVSFLNEQPTSAFDTDRYGEVPSGGKPVKNFKNLFSHRYQQQHPDVRRRRARVLQSGNNSDGFDELDGCQIEWYGSNIMLEGTNLVSVWKVESEDDSALDADVLLDICEAETVTLNELETRGLCYGCPDNKCLPPYSLVLMARQALQEQNGFSLSCRELADVWPSIQQNFTNNLATCVEDIKLYYNPEGGTANVTSCPAGFVPTVVDDKFDRNNLIVQYTSSYFATGAGTVDGIYDIVDELDRSDGDLVIGAYDTTYEDFVGMYANDVLLRDMILALGSAAVTVVAILIHTRSPWLTLLGLIQIVLSFPLSYFVYHFIAQLEFFPFLNFIGLFVVFALGADDIFVAVDKWRNARLELKDGKTEEVAALALPDAAGAMLLTSLTTSVAFFGTAICPVAPIKCFAVFCGLLIVFDYFMNVLLVFPALCLYDKWLLNGKHSWYIICFRRKSETTRTEASSENGEHSAAEPKKSLIHRILGQYYKYLHRFRWPLLVVCVAAIVVCSIIAATLDMPTSSDVRILSDDNQFELNYQWKQNLLSEELESRSGSEAYVIWGVVPADTGNHNNPDSWTTLELDDKFVPRTTEAQNYLLSFCDRLYETEFAGKPYAGYDCPINVFDAWLQEQSASAAPEDAYTLNCGGATSVPVAADDFDSCIIAWSQLVDERSVLQERGEVQIMFIRVQSIARYDSPYSVLDDEWHKFEDWLEDERDSAPDGVDGMYHSSEDFWWYDTNGQMLQTAYGAAAIALSCAAIVVFISSRSFVLTIFSVIAIGYVLVATTACLVGLGWVLGFLESICFAILIGISCDFVIHFGHAYALYPGKRPRNYRTKFALIHMGPSVLAAAVTTFSAAIIMLFTEITFFQKFAVILFFTVLHSAVASYLVFLVLTDCIGPSEPTKLFDTIVAKCHSAATKCCRKKAVPKEPDQGADNTAEFDETQRMSSMENAS